MEQAEQHIAQAVQNSILESLNWLDSYSEQQPDIVLSTLQNIIDHAQQIATSITDNSIDNSSDNA